MSLLDIFKRKNYASPYYGGRGALFKCSAVPLRTEAEKSDNAKEPATIEAPAPVRYTPTSAAPDWEKRRFELVKMLIAQERRSVVLGKLKASNKQIAATARSLADAAIKELQTHPFKSHDEGAKEDAV